MSSSGLIFTVVKVIMKFDCKTVYRWKRKSDRACLSLYPCAMFLTEKYSSLFSQECEILLVTFSMKHHCSSVVTCRVVKKERRPPFLDKS